MKITLTLPDWVDERHIYILAGVELVAYKHFGEKWKVKKNRCVQCGECCTGHKQGNPHMEIDKDGTCIYLIPDGEKQICGKVEYRGFNCATGDPIKDKWSETNCKITYR